jgi:hypothetical protein
MAALQLLGMGRPGASHEGPREAGIGQRRGCRDRVSWRPHPAAGSHLPSEGTAPPCAVAPFRVVAPCPAPQKLHTPPRPTAGFRMMLKCDSRTAAPEHHTMTNPKLLTQKQEIISWLDRVRSSDRFEVEPIALNKSNAWVQEQGTIRHVSGRFFGIIGLTWREKLTQYWQPFIDQREVGTLGFIVRRREGGIDLLVQAKKNGTGQCRDRPTGAELSSNGKQSRTYSRWRCAALFRVLFRLDGQNHIQLPSK